MSKKTLDLIRQTGNEAVIQVKRNQPGLHDQLTAWAQAHAAEGQGSTVNAGRRNRVECRTATVWTIPQAAAIAEWESIRCLIRIQRDTDLFQTRQNAFTARSETAWYLCTQPLTAQEANAVVRSHWGIENALHHVRDVTMKEDASRIRKQPGVMACLRSWSLNLIRRNGHHHVKAARETFAWSPDAAWECVNND